MTENEISYLIRGAVFSTYNSIGPGVLESVYVAVLALELTERGLQVKTEVSVPIIHKSVRLETCYRIDLLVNDLVLIEVKSVEKLMPVHHKQVLTYLRLSGIRLGLLVNFNTDNISSSIIRLVNKL